MADDQRATAVLVIFGGEYQGEHIELSGDSLALGRSADCDVILRSKDVSSHHAQLVVRDRSAGCRTWAAAMARFIRKKRSSNSR